MEEQGQNQGQVTAYEIRILDTDGNVVYSWKATAIDYDEIERWKRTMGGVNTKITRV